MFARDQLSKFPFTDEFFDVREVFGMPDALERSVDEIDAVYLEKEKRKFDLKTFFAWKVLRDRWYRGLVPTMASFKELYDGGFFVDALEGKEAHLLKFQPGECRTPIAKIAANLSLVETLKNPVVLLCTGAFSPLHNGHVGMLERAKKELESRGYQVIGGYLSPSHDAYVSTKYAGDAHLLAAHRVYLAQIAVADSDSWVIDPWEARYLPTDINFTDVAARLENYLNYYLKPSVPIRVCFVFGDDNIGFVRAFVHGGIGVCVARTGTKAVEFEKMKSAAPESEVFMTPIDGGALGISSSKVRRWANGLLPEKTESLYFKWKKDLLSVRDSVQNPKKMYVIRDDGAWSLAPWQERVSAIELEKAKRAFLADLETLIHRSFLRVLPPDIPLEVDVRVYPLDEQESYIAHLRQKEHLLNIDACTNDSAGIQCSRLFRLCDGQVKSKQLIARPGFAEVPAQLAAITPGDYTIVDDDIASGTTMNMLLGMLPEPVRVTKIRTLLEHSRQAYLNAHLGAEDREEFDVVDLRDFIFGSRAGGLVVGMPDGRIARVPYSLPYLSLVTRASIPPSTEMSFSKEIWQLNLRFFSSLGVDIRIADTDPSFRTFCDYLGFGGDMTMAEFCKKHIETLSPYHE